MVLKWLFLQNHRKICQAARGDFKVVALQKCPKTSFLPYMAKNAQIWKSNFG